MKKIYLLSVLLFCVVSINLNAQTTKTGVYNDPESWSGIIHITGNITINNTLTIAAGTQVIAQGDYSFTISSSGSVLAEGTETDLILFTRLNGEQSTSNRWEGITITISTTDPLTSNFNYCTFQYGQKDNGGAFNITNNDDFESLFFNDCIFQFNSTPYGAFHAGAVRGNAVYRNCVFRKNFAYHNGSAAYGGKFYDCIFYNNKAYYQWTGTVYGADLYNCIIFNNKSGFHSCSLINCIVANNGEFNQLGGAVYKNTVFWNEEFYYPSTGLANAENCAFNGEATYGTNAISLSSQNEGENNSPYFLAPTTTTGHATNDSELEAMENADWSISGLSALIDRGADLEENATDFNGVSRLKGGTPDIGPFEFGITRNDFQIDYLNEKIKVRIPTTVSYSVDGEGNITGGREAITLEPGSIYRFTGESLDQNGQAFEFVVPARPLKQTTNSVVDYAAKTVASIVNGDEYRIGDTGEWISGPIASLSITPTTTVQTLYIRTEASETEFASESQEISFALEPQPTYSIDYVNERISVVIPSTLEYRIGSGDWITGTGEFISIIPQSTESTISFRTLATADAFESDIQEITIPVIPAAPSYTIDFPTAKTSQVILATDQYRIGVDGTWTNGNGEHLELNPGNEEKTFFFKSLATSSAFESSIQELIIPERTTLPPPIYTINYNLERTVENVPNTVEYRFGNTSIWIPGTGETVNLNPEETETIIYFRTKGSENSFPSESRTLIVPARPPSMPSITEDDNNDIITIEMSTGFEQESMYEITLDMTANEPVWVNASTMMEEETDLMKNKLKLINNPTFNISVGNNQYDIGDIGIRIAASNEQQNFASEIIVTDIAFTTTVGFENLEAPVYMYPNPTNSILVINLDEVLSVQVLDSQGVVILPSIRFEIGDTKEINFTTLPVGVYFIKLMLNKQIIIKKVIKK